MGKKEDEKKKKKTHTEDTDYFCMCQRQRPQTFPVDSRIIHSRLVQEKKK